MHILITGGLGRVGSVVTERLVQKGDDVRVIGIEPDPQMKRIEYQRCDILDYAAVRDQMRGIDAVIHLAAIPSPRSNSGAETFQVNAAGTFNVFEAAADEGIRRIVQASSINAFGCAWSMKDVVARYFPIDEAHSRFTTDPYSFSKQVIEDIGDYYWRRDGISSVAMRFPAVWPADYVNSERFREGRIQMIAALDELVAQPEDQRKARLAEARERALAFREQKRMEYPYPSPEITSGSSADDLILKAYTFDRFNFWAFVDDRDSAQAMDKALTADFEGSHALFINADQNWLGYDSETLLRLFYPQVSERTRPLQGSETLVNIDKARALIGYAPDYTVKR
ncbi:MAG: NAD-dependent epimerase/dehydratase family protein [Chloroflexi bacterium]|nr:NAD-dependent epimerase/dehydratase family protein [Chloroflexota bacterium]